MPEHREGKVTGDHANTQIVADHEHQIIRVAKLIGQVFGMARKVKVFRLNVFLLIGAVTSTSISPFFKSSVAASSACNESSPAVLVDLPRSIFTSCSLMLMMFARLGLAESAFFIRLKLKSLIFNVLRWYEAILTSRKLSELTSRKYGYRQRL